MSVDPSVLEALQGSVAQDPENKALRIHLAGLLLQADRAQDALAECAAVLAQQPDHLEALELAARSAREAGDTARAESYRTLWTALSGSPVPSEAVTGPRPVAPLASESPEAAREPEDEEQGEGAQVIRLRAIRGGKGRAADLGEIEDPEITLREVAGMEEVKRRLELAFLAPLRNPELRAAYGKSLRGGLLLYGPPGCGKTFIARATAGELGASFFTVGIVDVLNMWLGESERNLHEIFETARSNAPCVLFLDEIDALGQKRSHLQHSAGRTVVNQLLDELDNVGSSNEGVFVLAATNHPWDVDAALRRPGRLDRTVLVLPPDDEAREGVLRYHLDGRPVEGRLDVGWIASRTERFSGADLAHLVESASELAMSAAIESGEVKPLGRKEFKAALSELKPSTEGWFQTAKNYALYANEGGLYDDLLEYIRRR